MEPNGYMNISIFGDSTCFKECISLLFFYSFVAFFVAMQTLSEIGCLWEVVYKTKEGAPSQLSLHCISPSTQKDTELQISFYSHVWSV